MVDMKELQNFFLLSQRAALALVKSANSLVFSQNKSALKALFDKKSASIFLVNCDFPELFKRGWSLVSHGVGGNPLAGANLDICHIYSKYFS